MHDTITKLQAACMVFRNSTVRWASPPLIVPQPGQEEFFFTVDLRAVHRIKFQSHYSMPVLEHKLTKLSNSNCFAYFDRLHGYWQPALHGESQEFQSFLSSNDVFTSPLVVHRTTNIVVHLQSCPSAAMPLELAPVLMQWLNDLLLHCATVTELLNTIAALFKLCAHLHYLLHPAKCLVYYTQIL